MKKKINILLIIAVVALWGAVGYRFVNNYFFASDNVLQLTGQRYNTPNLIIERDTFELQPLARDPFLNKPSHSSENIQKKSNSIKRSFIPKKTIIPKPVIEAVWPDIEYNGYIKSGSNKELVLMKINGQLFRVRKGETKNEITVQNIYKDSIVVKFNKEQRSFRHSR